jgi:hypothetical protein
LPVNTLVLAATCRLFARPNCGSAVEKKFTWFGQPQLRTGTSPRPASTSNGQKSSPPLASGR